MFRLYKLVKDEVNGTDEIRELQFDEKVEWRNGRPPLNIEIICTNEAAGMTLKYSFNPLMSSGFFTVEFNKGLPDSLITSTENYCQRIKRPVWGNKSTKVTSLYSRHDDGEFKKYFCQYFNEVENYFVNYFKSEPALSNDKMFRYFDKLRESMLLPERQRVFSLQAYCMNALFKVQEETGAEVISSLPEVVQYSLKDSLI